MTSRSIKVPVIEKIKSNAQDVYKKILASQKPTMSTPIRSLSNVKYSARKGHFEMQDRAKKRTLTVSTVKTFAQTLKMMVERILKEQVDERIRVIEV